MTEKLADKLVFWLTRHKAVSTSDFDLYRYAAFLVIYTAYPLGIVLILGALQGIFWGNSLLFAFSFIILRKYSGGFHFHSKYACLFISILTEYGFLVLANIHWDRLFFSVLFCLSIASLLCLSPVLSKERPFSDTTIRRCKISTFYTLAFLSFFCYLLCCAGYDHIAAYPKSAVIMTALLQFPAVIKNRPRNLCG